MVYQLPISTVLTNILLGGSLQHLDSLNVIMELLGIKFNSLYMPLLNDDEVTLILDFICVRRDV